MVAAKKVDKADTGFAQPLQSSAKSGSRWPWPAAALVIVMLSLLLWGGIAVIALLGFN